MAEKSGGEESGGQEKSLEMRVAELEDKLAQMHITEDEIKAYQKVAGMLGQAGGAAAGGVTPMAQMAQPCIAPQNIQQQPIGQAYRPIVWQCIRCIIYRCWAECGWGGPCAGPIAGGIDPGQDFGQFGG